MKVTNMTGRTGRAVVDQFVIDGISPESFNIGVKYEPGIWGYAFQSYRSVIVFMYRGQVYLDAEKWDFSPTTGKYRNQFLGETKKETQVKIDSGEYVHFHLGPCRRLPPANDAGLPPLPPQN